MKYKEKLEKELLEAKEKWEDSLISNEIGYCSLCEKENVKITEHHLVPQRVLKILDKRMSNFMDNFKLKICKKCHSYMHPENVWYFDMLKTKEEHIEEIKRIESFTTKQVNEQLAITSKSIQDLNNIKLKLNSYKKDIENKNEKINDLKEQLKEAKQSAKQIKNSDTDVDSLINISKDLQKKISQCLGYVFSDNETYQKYLRNVVDETMIEHLDKGSRTERDVSFRDFNVMIKLTLFKIKEKLNRLDGIDEDFKELIDEFNNACIKKQEDMVYNELNEWMKRQEKK